jgi:ABC-2 family transporter protein
MIWVAWRQHRKQALIEAGVVAVGAVLLLLSGYQMLHVFKSSGLAKCLATVGADCGDLRDSFSNHYNGYQFVVPLFLLAPVLFGVFFGAPLIAREVENGTHRLAWTQGVTRKRWVSTHALMVAGFAIAGSAALAGLVTWWSHPLVSSSGSGRFAPGIFDLRGIVPIAYTIFAVMLGVAVGMLVKKTLPAVGLTLVGFAAVRVTIILYVRQFYMGAKTMVLPFGQIKDSRSFVGIGNWVIGQNTINRAGHVVSRGGGFPDFSYLAARCPGVSLPPPIPVGKVVGRGGIDPIFACVQRLGLRLSTTYQPAHRYWTFQWIEFGIFIALALALAWFVVRRVRRLA